MADFKHIVNIIPLTRINLQRSQIFTYIVPPKLHGLVHPGQIVKCPLGSREVLGVVSSQEMHRLANEVKMLKEFISIEVHQAIFTQQNFQVAESLAQKYITPLGLVCKTMLPALVKKPKSPSLVGYEPRDPDFVLTEYQRLAVSQIANSLERAGSFLLHGVTGSGKTEVYLQLAKRVLDQGKQIIILVPEISLTPQIIKRFAERFGIEKIALLHSRLKDSERFWMWQKIFSEERKIIIGPRSAVFAPVRDLGLIVLDEEHDYSFKQDGQHPKYHAREVAVMLSQVWSCPLVFGDATPSLETYSQTERGEVIRLELPHRIKADLGMPTVEIVDMREELAAGNVSIFSEALKKQILENLKNKKQIVLFLNRRGAATFVMCRDCGEVLTCPNCSVPFVWHTANQKLVCHHCARAIAQPKLCPICQSHRIKEFGVGTQRVETELIKFLQSQIAADNMPQITRMDRDTTAKKNVGEKIYEDWKSGKINILIGTQMISKGWDVSRVGLVGIVSADSILNLPDFRSAERTFQVLTQVAGRTGRGSDPGKVVLQTYRPDNYAIQAVKLHDYDKFFQQELEYRKKFHYPPFVDLVKLTVSHGEKIKAQELAEKIFKSLGDYGEGFLEILGPTPAFIPRVRSKYRFQLVLKIEPPSFVESGSTSAGSPSLVSSQQSSEDLEWRRKKINLYEILKSLPTGVDIDVDPENLL